MAPDGDTFMEVTVSPETLSQITQSPAEPKGDPMCDPVGDPSVDPGGEVLVTANADEAREANENGQ